MDSSIYRLRLRDILGVCVLALLCLGVLMVQSASMSISVKDPAIMPGWHWSDRGLKHLIFAFVSILVFFAVSKIDYTFLVPKPRAGERLLTTLFRSPIVWLTALAAFACVAVLIPHVGMEVNGSRRWIKLGPIQIQPSEMAKWACVLFLAWWLSARPLNTDRFFTGFLPTLIPVGVLCLLVVIQDFGTAALIGGCALTMLLAGRVKLWHLAIVIPPAALAAFWFVHHEPYRWRRMTAFLDPYAAPKNEGYHMIQSLLSFSTGGVLGKGLGNGIQKLGYLPEDTTDFIFAVVCEELGLFGAMFTVACYAGILYVAWQTVKQKRDGFGQLLAFGVASMICLQAVINIAVATVSVPTKGLSLPLVSAGGSGLVITCAALGLMCSVTRSESEKEPAHLSADESAIPAAA